MSKNVRLEGLEEVQKRMRKLGVNVDRELSEVVRATTLAVSGAAQTSIAQGTKSGVTYQLSNPNRTHTASAPGEAPATDTGRLVQSISTRFSQGGLQGVVFTPLDYGKYLEFGTQTIKPRPWLLPALESQRAAWRIRLRRVVDDASQGLNTP